HMHEKVPAGKAILLGHTGFLGQALAVALERARSVVVGHSSSTLDLRRREAFASLDGITADDTLIVCAALTPDRGGTVDVLADNLTMMLNLARHLEAHPVRRCVYVSSDAVYPMQEAPVDEATPVDPARYYGLAKYAGERILLGAAERGLRLLIVRPTAVFGP